MTEPPPRPPPPPDITGPPIPIDRGAPPRRAKVWTVLLVLPVVSAIAALFLTPIVQQRLNDWALFRQADQLTTIAREQLLAGNHEEAAATAREALLLIPDHPPAVAVVDSAKAQAERREQRRQAGEAALAEAEKRIGEDDIQAAIDAFSVLRGNSSEFPESINRQVADRILALRSVTATLSLPDDWPEEAYFLLDGKTQSPKQRQITGIPLGTHTIEMTREGYRRPPPVKLEFRGIRPLPLPPFAWKPVGGSVILTSTPAGAEVWRDGKHTGKTTPCTFEDVDVGKIEFTLKLGGHFDTSVGGDVTSGGQLNLNGTLHDTPRLPTDGKQAGELREINITPGLRVAFRWCPAGSFVMGGADRDAQTTEKPIRRVTLSQGFWLGETEFTQAQWEAVEGRQSLLLLLSRASASLRPGAEGPGHPVILASWDQICGNNSRSGGILGDINGFFKTSKVTGWVADLPSEAQWEYACRAGTTGPFGIPATTTFDDSAWYRSNSQDTIHAAGLKAANPWGFRDMHGNVGEWCRDWFQENYLRLPDTDPVGPRSGWTASIRGGSFRSPASSCRSAARGQASSGLFYDGIGFRLILRHTESPPSAAPKPNPQKPNKAAPGKPAKKPAKKKR